MNQTFSPIPVPHQLRESVIAGDGFVQHMRARGWSVADVRPIYTDPEVIRQSWLVCPNGARYSDRAFYHLFGITRFRKLLRVALLRTPCTTSTFAALCPDASELHTYLTFLQDQELLHNEGNVWSRGKRLFQIADIGHTLEWYVAEWFRLTQTYRSRHLIPVRHGVTFHRSLNVGDIDVVALLDSSWTVTLECKSSSKISTNELALFLKRATLLQPAIAVLLIDTPTLSLDGHIRRLNALLAKNGEELLIPVASVEGLYWGAKHMCVTCVSQSLPSALEAVLQVIEQQMSPLT
jgi:hypothetical protein